MKKNTVEKLRIKEKEKSVENSILNSKQIMRCFPRRVCSLPVSQNYFEI